MFQLNIHIINSQIFWLLIKFNFFYLIFIWTCLLLIIRLFKIRDKFFKKLSTKEEQGRFHFYTLVVYKIVELNIDK